MAVSAVHGQRRFKRGFGSVLVTPLGVDVSQMVEGREVGLHLQGLAELLLCLFEPSESKLSLPSTLWAAKLRERWKWRSGLLLGLVHLARLRVHRPRFKCASASFGPAEWRVEDTPQLHRTGLVSRKAPPGRSPREQSLA